MQAILECDVICDSSKSELNDACTPSGGYEVPLVCHFYWRAILWSKVNEVTAVLNQMGCRSGIKNGCEGWGVSKHERSLS
jgi:hypothetical protein